MDGKISNYDFTCMVALFIGSEIQERLDSVFFLFDTDHSHIIDNQELYDLVEAILTVKNNGKKID